MSKKLIYLVSFVLVLGVTVSADAGTDAFQEVGGMVVMEGENFHAADGRTDENNYEWRISNTQAGFVGTGYVDTPGPKGTNGEWANACEVTYEIKFSTPGQYSVWVRRYALNNATNSCRVGLDGGQDLREQVNSDYNQWIWKLVEGTIEVTAGPHTFNLRRRESEYKVDRILLTTDSAYTPTGDGPPESPRGIPANAANASNPYPADMEPDAPYKVVLSWTPGEFAAPTNGHKVYFGENFNDVNDAIGGVAQDANSYAPAQRLDFGTTYYWRVDEVNAPPTSQIEFKGEVWSFTTEPVAYPIAGENIIATASSTGQPGMGPENTINGLGLDANDLHSTEATDMWLSSDEPNGAWIEYELDKVHKLHEMWVWNSNQNLESVLGFGLKDVTIEYSTNGTDYTTLGTTHEFARAPGTPDYAHNTTVDFGGVTAKFVRLTANSNWGGILPQYGLSEVRFFSIPVFAREPSPDSGTTDVAVDVTLGFRAGREAAQHDVYLSTDEQAVIDSTAGVTTVTETSYGPLSLDLGTTYYWKINEVNEAETTTTWQGEIWNFTTPEFFVVDGFEDYNDYPPDEIWSTWVDGYGVPANGATAGYPAPDFLAGEHYVETTIVHGGEQAMPFFYDNTGTATYSEGERTFAVPQDWTKAGVQTLALYFNGTPGNTGQLYVKVNGSKVVYDGDAGNLARAGWQAWNIDLASFGTNLQSVTTLGIGIDGSGASGTLYFDDIRLYSYSRQFITPAEPNSVGLLVHLGFDDGFGTIAGDLSGNGNVGTLMGDPQWVAGKIGGALDFGGDGDHVLDDDGENYINGLDALTVCMWIKSNLIDTDKGFLHCIDPSGQDRVVSMRYDSAGSSFGGDDILKMGVQSTGGEQQLESSANLQTTEWQHVTMTWVSEGLIMFYVNGVEDTPAGRNGPNNGGTVSQCEKLIIGKGGKDELDSDGWDGLIDDVRIYNRVLSQAEIAWLAGMTLPFDKPF
ncbi:MAG: discoidin domain-containing protein [Planctomycetes bacterium]|nr:discoidin domain-containing protein [Planctomycetota bacterium]